MFQSQQQLNEGEDMDQDKLNKILQIVGELTINLRLANEEIQVLKTQINEMKNKVITNVQNDLGGN